MKSPAKIRSGIRGTIMIFALIVILGGALVLGAWVQMLATRAAYPDTTAEAVKRRIAFANGRALAREFLLEQMPLNPTNRGTNFQPNYFLPNNWGGFYLFFSRDNNFWTNTSLTQGNPFNAFGGVSFADTNNTFWLAPYYADTNNREYWTFRVRSHSPLMSDYPLVVHNPSTSTNTNASGNDYRGAMAVFWTNIVGYTGLPAVPFTAGTNTNGYAGVFSAPLTTNYTNITNITYADISTNTNAVTYSNVGGATGTNTFVTNSITYTNYSGAKVTVVLSPTNTESILRFNVPSFVTYTNARLVYSNATVTNLFIVGSAQTNALHIIATNTANPTNMTLSGNTNSRRIVLNKSGSSLTLKTTNYASGGVWWLALTVSGGNPLSVAAPTSSGTLNIRGGFRTDGNITVTTGIFSNSFEPNPGNEEYITDRIMWLEDIRTDQ